MGKSYLIQHCTYVYNHKQERRAFEIYMSDRIKAVNDSIASVFGGSTSTSRYIDILERMMDARPEETRTAEQIISAISEKLERLNDESV